ncbi:MAG TPA: DNA internalization-related competence protein ComEC/Rec2 [Nitrospira sp.]|nr:DNA internalization-related competence protein ComEC/Rec2 [Nitrospira sp.]
MLPSLTVAFLIGLVCGAQVPFFPLSTLTVLLVLAVALSLVERAGMWSVQSALVLYVTVLSGVIYWSLATASPSHHLSSVVHSSEATVMTGRVIVPVQYGAGRQTIILETDEGTHPPARLRLVWRNPGFALHHGDRVTVHGRYHPPQGGLNPGGFDYAAYLEHQGIDLVGTIAGTQAVTLLESGSGSSRWCVWNKIDHWRTSIREASIQSLHQPALGIVLGMIIGERGYIEQELQDWFMATGTVHLLSISGSHLGLVGAVVYWIVKLFIVRMPTTIVLTITRRLTLSQLAMLVTWPAVVLYTLLAGAELATVRSLVMITMAMVAVWLGHDRHLHHTMAIALFLIVWHDPRAIFDISFQLSFLSVFVMIQMISLTAPWDQEPIQDENGWGSRAARYGTSALSFSAVLTMTTFPLVAFYFNQVPWLGMLTNLVAIPLTGFILVPFGLCLAIWTLLTGSHVLAWGQGLEDAFMWLIDGVRWFATLPGAQWPVAAPSVPTMMLFYSGVLTASFTTLSKQWRIAGASLALALIVWWLVPLGSRSDGDHWRVTFLDVGQGDSALVELPDGQTVLIDGGARSDRFDMGRSVVAPFLWNRGVSHIDHVIGTHQQLDHVGGLIWILQHLSVGQFWDQGVEREEHFVTDLTAALQSRGIPKRTAIQGQEVLNRGPCHLTILNPQQDARPALSMSLHTGTELNNRSIVSRLECGAHSILFAADIETSGLHQLPEGGHQPVTVLKVPHHGARSSLDQDWIRQIQPKYAIISVGSTNPYGHPAPGVIKMYEDQAMAVYRTDRDGAVWVQGRVSHNDLTVTSMRELLIQPIDLFTCPWRCEQQNWQRVLTTITLSFR